MKKIVSILLILPLMVNMASSALADRMPEEDRSVFFVSIYVNGVADELPESYRGARDDENDLVYIHAYDLADIVGAEVVREGTGENCVLH